MKLKDLKKLSPNIAIIEKIKDGPWSVKKFETTTPRGFVSGNEINRKNALAHAVELNPTLIAERRGRDEHIIVRSQLNREFLTGLGDVAGVVEDVLFAHKSKIPSEQIRRCVSQVDFFANRQKKTLRPQPTVITKVIKPLTVKSLSQYDKNSEINSPGLFKLNEVLALSAKTAFLDKKDKNYYYYSKHGAKTRQLAAWAIACQQAVNDLQCNIIAERVGANSYKLVYADTSKNYLRGIMAAAQALKNVQLAPYVPASQKLKVFNDQIIKYANIARADLGYKGLAAGSNPKYCDQLLEKDKVRPAPPRERS